jgi:hypothetical protein
MEDKQMTFTNTMRLAERTTVTEVAMRLLLESHCFDGFSELTRKGDLYAIQLMSGESEGRIEFAVVTNLSPVTLNGLTGATTNLMSRIASGEAEVLGRVTHVQEGLILDISLLGERQLREEEGNGFCQHSIIENGTVN